MAFIFDQALAAIAPAAAAEIASAPGLDEGGRRAVIQKHLAPVLNPSPAPTAPTPAAASPMLGSAPMQRAPTPQIPYGALPIASPANPGNVTPLRPGTVDMPAWQSQINASVDQRMREQQLGASRRIAGDVQQQNVERYLQGIPQVDVGLPEEQAAQYSARHQYLQHQPPPTDQLNPAWQSHLNQQIQERGQQGAPLGVDAPTAIGQSLHKVPARTVQAANFLGDVGDQAVAWLLGGERTKTDPESLKAASEKWADQQISQYTAPPATTAAKVADVGMGLLPIAGATAVGGPGLGAAVAFADIGSQAYNAAKQAVIARGGDPDTEAGRNLLHGALQGTWAALTTYFGLGGKSNPLVQTGKAAATGAAIEAGSQALGQPFTGQPADLDRILQSGAMMGALHVAFHPIETMRGVGEAVQQHRIRGEINEEESLLDRLEPQMQRAAQEGAAVPNNLKGPPDVQEPSAARIPLRQSPGAGGGVPEQNPQGQEAPGALRQGQIQQEEKAPTPAQPEARDSAGRLNPAPAESVTPEPEPKPVEAPPKPPGQPDQNPQRGTADQHVGDVAVAGGTHEQSVPQPATAAEPAPAPAPEPELKPFSKEWAQKRLADIESRRQEALAKLTPEQRRYRGSSVLEPEQLFLRGVVAAHDIAAKVKDFASWSKEMIAQLGEPIREHLATLWDHVRPRGSDSATSIKNTQTDLERAMRGLPSATEAARRELPGVWDKAVREVDENPDVQRNLIDELKNKPRSITDREVALLLHKQIQLQNDFHKSAQKLVVAQAHGDHADIAENRVRSAQLSDQLRDLYNVNRTTGTETGRGLSARKLLAQEDYSLAAMETRKRAANEGKPLSDDQKAKIADLHQQIEKTQAAVEEHAAAKTPPAQKPKKELTDEQRVKIATRQVEKDIADLDRRIAAGDLSARTGKKTPQTEDLKTLRAKRDTLREQLNQLREADTPTVENKKEASLAKAVEDLQKRIDAGELATKQGKPTADSQRVSELKGQRDALNKKMAELRSAAADPALAENKKEASLAKAVEDLQKRIAAGDLSARSSPGKATADTEKVARMRTQRDSLQKQLDDLRKAARPKTPPDQVALKAAKARLAKSILDTADRLANEDYAARPRRAVALDEEGLRLQAENQRLKDIFDRDLLRDRLKQRSIGEKVADTFVKWRRGFVLSSPVTLAKLTSAGLERMAFTPLEEAVGYGLSKVVPGVAKRAPREGGFSVRAEAKAITDGFTKGMSDSWQLLRTGKSNLDVVYGKGEGLPPDAIDFIGTLHGALKTPTKRNEFARSMQKRVEFAIRNGLDATDPLLLVRVANESYQDANRSIFMQDNRLISAYKAFISGLEKPDKTTGKPAALGKAGATALRTLFPVVKIPTNIIAETLQYALGTVTGGARLARAYAKGIENLKPEQADLIMRSLKKGLLGPAVLALGFFNPDNVGGYYQPGQKRDRKDVKAGSIRLFGHDLPSYLIHNPLLELLQIGATVRRVADSKLKKKDEETQGIGAGSVAAALGLVDEVPFVRETETIHNFIDPKAREKQFGETAAGVVVPQAAQFAARQTDKDAQGNPTKRKPEGIVQNIEMGIPGLRKKVPLEQIEKNTPAEKAVEIYLSRAEPDRKEMAPAVLKKVLDAEHLTPDQQDKLLAEAGLEPPADLALSRELHQLNQKASEVSKAKIKGMSAYRKAGQDPALREQAVQQLRAARLSPQDEARRSELEQIHQRIRDIQQRIEDEMLDPKKGEGQIKRLVEMTQQKEAA